MIELDVGLYYSDADTEIGFGKSTGNITSEPIYDNGRPTLKLIDVGQQPRVNFELSRSTATIDSFYVAYDATVILRGELAPAGRSNSPVRDSSIFDAIRVHIPNENGDIQKSLTIAMIEENPESKDLEKIREIIKSSYGVTQAAILEYLDGKLRRRQLRALEQIARSN